MPKRYGRRETWRRKVSAWANPPEVRRLRRATYDPFFMRQLHTSHEMRGEPGHVICAPEWVDDCGYCLDRTEIHHHL